MNLVWLIDLLIEHKNNWGSTLLNLLKCQKAKGFLKNGNYILITYFIVNKFM